MSFRCFFWALSLFIGIPSVSFSEIPSRLVLVTAGDSDALLTQRIQLELKAIGFESKNIHVLETQFTDDQLEYLAHEYNAIGIISIITEKKAVYVWVTDGLSGRIVSRQIRITTDNMPTDEVISVAAVELFRASLMELNAVKSLTEEKKEVPTDLELSKTEQTRKKKEGGHGFVSLDFGSTFLDANASWGVTLSGMLYVSLMKRLRLGLGGALPLKENQMDVEPGILAIDPWYAHLELLFIFTPDTIPFRGAIGGGVGLGVLSFNGRAKDDWEDGSATMVSFVGSLKFQMGIRLQERLYLIANVCSIWPTHSASLLAYNDQVAHLGYPWLVFTGGLEARIW